MGDVIEPVRWANCVLAVVGLLWMGIRSFHWRHDYPYTVLLFLFTLSFFVLGVAYASAEQAIQNAEPGVRTIISTVSVLSLLVTLAMTQRCHRVILTGDSNYGGPGMTNGR